MFPQASTIRMDVDTVTKKNSHEEILDNFKNKNIDTKLAIFVSIGGALGAIIGANISVNIGVQKLRRLFGIFLVIIVIHEIYTLFKEYKMSKKSNTKFS